MKLTVDVTEGDIRKAVARRDSGWRPTNCPIALALRRITGKYIEVGSGVMNDGSPALRLEGITLAPMPEEAWMFAYKFDSERAIEPSSFTFEVPDSLYEHPST